ncbi:1368_t:CDS:1, partial [Funneliformis geosporum]
MVLRVLMKSMCDMCHIENGETPTEWKNRIWNLLMYFRNKKYYTYDKEDCFYAHKALPHLVDEQTYSLKCGMAIN